MSDRLQSLKGRQNDTFVITGEPDNRQDLGTIQSLRGKQNDTVIITSESDGHQDPRTIQSLRGKQNDTFIITGEPDKHQDFPTVQSLRGKQNETFIVTGEPDNRQDLRTIQSETFIISGESDSDDQSSERTVSDQEVSNENDSSDENEGDENEEIALNETFKAERSKLKNETNYTEFICEALGDFAAEESSDLSFKKGDILTVIAMRSDGWWKAEDSNGHKGMVPSSFLKVPGKIQQYVDGTTAASSSPDTGHLWQKLRSTVKQSHNVGEAITAMGALPIGFCQASLKQLIDKDSRYTTEAFLAPKLNDSGLAFQDLHLSANTKSLKPITTPVQRIVRLVAFRQVCSPGPGFEVSSRHVRICLHDGSKVLSNIHTIRAQFDPKTPKIWTFLPKISSSGACLEEGQFFIRSNTTSPTIGVLFQLCISYIKIATSEIGEMCCGWVFMRLLDDSGVSVSNRTKVLRIQGGIPFISQNSSSSTAGTKSGPLNVFLNRGKTPRLVVTLSTFKRKLHPLLNFLPTTLIGQVSSVPLLVLYRKTLGDKLLRTRTSFDSTDIVQSPFLVCFPKMFEQPDILDAFRKYWSDKGVNAKQSDLKNEEFTRMSFQQAFMETVFLLVHCNVLPVYMLGNMQVEKERKIEILRIMKLVKDNGPLTFAMSPEYQFHPISVKHLSLHIIGKDCFPIDGIE